MDKKYYEEFLEATREPPFVTFAKHLSRYALAKTASTVVTYPWESTVILRQIQCTSATVFRQTSPTIGKSLEEKRKEYEQYLLHPIESPVSRDVLEYQEDTPELAFPEKASLLSCIKYTAQQQGLGSLYQGSFAWNIKRISNDLFQETVVPVLAHYLGMENTVRGNLLIEALSTIALHPLEVAHVRSVAQSAYWPAKAFPNYFQVFKRSSLRELFSGCFYNVIARVWESVMSVGLSQLGCALVDRLAPSNYALLASSYFLVNCIAINAPLLVSAPLETLKRRAMVSNMKTRVGVNRLGLREQVQNWMSLYHGTTMRMTSNTILLSISLLSELEGEWIGENEDF